jgi:hypothetical protein
MRIGRSCGRIPAECPDCLMASLLGGPGRCELDEAERRALWVLAQARLVPAPGLGAWEYPGRATLPRAS